MKRLANLVVKCNQLLYGLHFIKCVFWCHVPGAYGVWAFRQPNNWSGHQDCGALASIDDQYKFGDENCYELMYYLCDIGN